MRGVTTQRPGGHPEHPREQRPGRTPTPRTSGAAGTFLLVASGLFACLPALILPACNLFQGFESFQPGAKTPASTPAPAGGSGSTDTSGSAPPDRATESSDHDSGGRTRAGSVDVRARLPEGALTPSPRPQEK